MRTYEINGNLTDINNYDNFSMYIGIVMNIFIQIFGKNIMSKLDLYIDNGTKDTGYTPITTPILKKYLIIKLKISDFLNSEQIVFQFSHELCHYVFYSLLGLDRKFAATEEENICSAMSIVIIKMIFPNKVEYWSNYVNNLEDERYNKGAIIAKNVDYTIEILKNKIFEICDSENLITV